MNFGFNSAFRLSVIHLWLQYNPILELRQEKVTGEAIGSPLHYWEK